MELYKLNRQVLRFKNGAREFLMAYSTNTPDKPAGAFVDVRGRIVAVFDQAEPPGRDEMLVVIDRAFQNRLIGHLDKYLRLCETVIEEEDYGVYFDLEGSYRTQEGDIVIPQKKGKLLLTRRPLSSTVTEEAFTWFRLEHHLPLQGVDYDDEMLLNVGDEEFVCYTKGCYLGQEIVARVHHRAKPPRKLVVRAEKECNEEEKCRLTSTAADPETGEKKGFLFVEN